MDRILTDRYGDEKQIPGRMNISLFVSDSVVSEYMNCISIFVFTILSTDLAYGNFSRDACWKIKFTNMEVNKTLFWLKPKGSH